MWWIEGMLLEYYCTWVGITVSWWRSLGLILFIYLKISEESDKTWLFLFACCRMLESKGFVVQAKKMAADWKLPEGWAVKLAKDGRLIKAGTTWQNRLVCDTEKQQERIWKNGTRWNEMERDGTRWNEMERDGTRWNEMERDGTRWNEMERDGTRWNEMERDGTRWNEMERDGTRITSMLWGLQTASYSKYWKSRFSLIHWHDVIFLGSASSRWMVLGRRRSTTPRQQNAVNLAVAQKTFSLFFSLFFSDRFFDWILVRKRLWKLQRPRCNGECRINKWINMDESWMNHGWTWWTQVGHVGAKCGASCTDGSCEAQKKVEEAKAAHQQMLSAQALPKMDRQEFSYSCGSKTKIFIDVHKKR